MRSIIQRSFALAAVLALLAAPAAAVGSRHAVVIGNAAYREVPLLNPVNDARGVAAALRDLGFQVDLVEDASRERMAAAVAAVRARFAPGSVGLFYYAGHALQRAGTNYLLPVGYPGGDAAGLAAEALTLDDVLAAMDQAGVRVAVVVLDACRDNPFGRPEEALGPGLAVVRQTRGETLIAYATGAGEVALDGAGPNSPFTAALVSALQRSGLGLYDMFRHVRAAVREATDGRQIPWVSGSLENDLVLHEAPAPAGSPLAEVTAATVEWVTIQASADPGDFDRFLSTHADHPLAGLARSRLARLAAEAAPATPEPVVAADPDGIGPRGGLLDAITECDLAAARPGDPRRLAEGVPAGLVNTRLALRVCARDLAAKPDDPRLQYQLGRVLDIAGRLGEARAFYEVAAAADYPAAQATLGQMHRLGRGVDPDPARGAALMRRAAELGYPVARNTLGGMYLRGAGVPRSPEEAFRWIKLAADDGWMNALDQLGNLYRTGEGVARDPGKAQELYRKAAQLGSTNAMHALGRMLRDGDGVARDVAAGREWLERASAEGNAYAARDLGQVHRRGIGTGRDPAKAARLFELAADRGLVEAYGELGAMREAGEGGVADLAEAYFYYRLTLESGRRRERSFSHKGASAGVARLGPRLDTAVQARVEERLADHLARLGPVPPLNVI